METIVVSHKIRLVPNQMQEEYFRKACGTARFTYNWGLAEWKRQYENGQKPSAYSLKMLFNRIKKEQFPWVAEVTKCAPEQAFADLQRAFVNFFRKNARYPNFKKKGRSKDSFYLSNDKFEINGKKVRIPKLGWVRMRETLRFSGKILSARVSRDADQWYIAIQVEIARPTPPTKNHGTVGMDVGLNCFAALSTGEKVLAPKPLRNHLKRLKKLQRRHARKQRGSQNRKKHITKLARLHLRIRNIRSDFLHKLSHRMTTSCKQIAIEDLNIKGMVKNHRLALSISDAGWGEFRRQLSYKTDWYGSSLYVVDRWFPSSKTCSQCGSIKDTLSLSERLYVCVCGNKMDRDVNAAVNLKLAATGGYPESNACGHSDRCAAAGLAV